MNRNSTSLGVAVLALASLAFCAEDFQPLMLTTQQTWPEKRHIGVICDYQASRDQVEALARAAGEGTLITVADSRRIEHATAAAQLLANQKTDFVVLMPQDRFFRDGSLGASLAVDQLASRGVPAVGTRADALKQGAAFSMGEGTEGQLLVNDKVRGTIDITLPHPSASQKSSLVLARHGKATIQVHPAD